MSRDARTRTQYTYVVGIDEAGRGPLAGPVAVCAVMSRGTLDMRAAFPGLDDSKRLTPKKREQLFGMVSHDIQYAVAYGSAEDIDELGITAAVKGALEECLVRLDPDPVRSFMYLDGLLSAPAHFSQKTVVHGDALIPAISLASVIAKVSRDALMTKLALEYPQYGFDRHKGYGTRAHFVALAAHGPSPLHRRSFLSG